MSRLVIVSNRVSLPRRNAAPGGLVVGVLAAMQRRGGLWFGWNGERAVSGEQPAEEMQRNGISYVTIELDDSEYSDFYQGFCNGILWPLFHYFLNGFHYSEQQFEAYLRFSQRVARELLPRLTPHDLIWVHDYHFLPLAQKLREAGATQPLGLFIHTPFPAAEVLRALPVCGELVQAMLAFDLIGFQTESDLRAFAGSVASLWGIESISADADMIEVGGHRTRLGVFPIGVDVDGVQQQAREAQQGDACRRMLAGLLGRKLMIGVDRLDYSKGLVERFRAYERFLEMHPDQQNRVTYLQIAPLSRADVRAYSTIRRELEQAAGRTNGRFADTDWTPIRYLNRNFPHDVVVGFMRAAPVGLVTPLRDGMNLVAKEFVAAQDDDDPGVLILSSMSGAARELDEALLVNPYDTRGIANAIDRALNMPLAERRERHQAMMTTLRQNDVHAWHDRFLAALAATSRSQSSATRVSKTITA